MAPMRLVLLTTLFGCATASVEPNGDSHARPDAATTRMDAPKQMGTGDAPTSGGCAHAMTGTLAVWDFATQPGSQVSTPVKTRAPGVVAGPVERAATLTPVSGTNAINSANWPTGLLPDLTKHYKLTLAPPSGCTISIATIAIDAKASATGPLIAAIATSADSYATAITISTAAASAPVMSIASQPAMVEVHVLGFGAETTSGTLRLQGLLTVTGSLQ
jgi:hypothetical protein